MVAHLIAAGGIVAGTLVAEAFADVPEGDTGTESETNTDTETKTGTNTETEINTGIESETNTDTETKTGTNTETEINTGIESEGSTKKVDESANDNRNRFRCVRGVASPVLIDLACRASTVFIDLTRRAGIDRYTEAELVEQLHAQEYARQVGGTVTENSASVFAPDGGVDRIVHVDGEVRTIQSKHHAKELSESVLQDYADCVDVMATSNGTSSSADPASYGLEEFTRGDWSMRAKARLECRRIFSGLVKGLRGVRIYLSRIVKSLWGVSTRLTSVLKRLGGAAARWVLGLTTLQQIVLAAGVVTVTWLAYQRVSTDPGFDLHLLQGNTI